jgi:glucosylceramidase
LLLILSIIMSKKGFNFLFLLFISTFSFAQKVDIWLTSSDQSALFQKQNTELGFSAKFEELDKTLPMVFVDESKEYQKMDGFGYTFTSGSATLINKMSSEKRQILLQELFGTKEKDIGISYLRIAIGASDLSESVYSYNDIAEGNTDLNLNQFSISPEMKDVIPVLKEIKKINPAIKLLGTPWSPPAWMKSNQNSKGGSLEEKYYEVYANYLVKYLQSMKALGLEFDAITVQNEPLHPENNPSLLMYPYQQANFIKSNLGPAFKRAKIKTKIIIYDHNADRPDYPLQILNDPAAREYIDGSAFHLYGGSVEAIGEVHDAFPDKNVYFTEQWTGATGTFAGDLNWHMRTLIIGASRNWCKTVLEWNLAIDSNFGPHTEGGCTECLGAVTIDGDSVKRNVSYYIIAHVSKFVRPNAVRIYSNQLGDISNVVFRTKSGKKVMIAQNESDNNQRFVIRSNSQFLTYEIPAKAVVTLVW